MLCGDCWVVAVVFIGTEGCAYGKLWRSSAVAVAAAVRVGLDVSMRVFRFCWQWSSFDVFTDFFVACCLCFTLTLTVGFTMASLVTAGGHRCLMFSHGVSGFGVFCFVGCGQDNDRTWAAAGGSPPAEPLGGAPNPFQVTKVQPSTRVSPLMLTHQGVYS